jgi:hypothetical protein
MQPLLCESTWPELHEYHELAGDVGATDASGTAVLTLRHLFVHNRHR